MDAQSWRVGVFGASTVTLDSTASFVSPDRCLTHQFPAAAASRSVRRSVLTKPVANGTTKRSSTGEPFASSDVGETEDNSSAIRPVMADRGECCEAPNGSHSHGSDVVRAAESHSTMVRNESSTFSSLIIRASCQAALTAIV